MKKFFNNISQKRKSVSKEKDYDSENIINALKKAWNILKPKDLKSTLFFCCIIIFGAVALIFECYFYKFNFSPEASTDYLLVKSIAFSFGLLIFAFWIGSLMFKVALLYRSNILKKEFHESSQEEKKIWKISAKIFVAFSIAFLFEAVALIYLHSQTQIWIIFLGLMPAVFLIESYVLSKLIKKSKVFSTGWVALFFALILLYIPSLTVCSVAIFSSKSFHSSLWIISVVQFTIVTASLVMASDKKISWRSSLVSAAIVLVVFLGFGIAKGIVQKLMLKSDILKEKTDISLTENICSGLKQAFECQNAIPPGVCFFHNVSAPVVIGEKHLVYIPIKQYIRETHCKTNKKMKKFYRLEVSHNDILFYGEFTD